MAVAAAQKNRELFAIKKSYSIEVSTRIKKKTEKKDNKVHRSVFFLQYSWK